MLSYRTIDPHTLELLKYLIEVPLFNECRLVGGTSLALQYGHRSSIDLDMFGDIPDNDLLYLDVLKEFGHIDTQKTSRIVKTFIVDGIKVDFVNCSMYPRIDKLVLEDGLRLASPKDIAALKTYAIQNRGSKKDFIDMFFLLQHFSLEDILGFYSQKYPNYSMFRTRMALTYFDDAENQESPIMWMNVEWETVKETISQEVRKINWNSYNK